MPLAILALAALTAQPEGTWRFDRPIDQGYEDASILGESFRLPMADLRQAAEWERVYRMDGSHGSVFARRHGGITAVFAQSDYLATPEGTVPTVPAGTVYVIGEPAPWLLRQLGLDDGYESLAPPPGRIDLSLATGAGQGGGQATTGDPRPGQASGETSPALEQARRQASMWYNDSVRVRRVSALLTAAASID